MWVPNWETFDLFEKSYLLPLLNDWLQVFTLEAKQLDGIEYPLKTIYQMLCGLLWYSRECQTDLSNILDWKNLEFKKFHGTCDSVFHSVHESRMC